MNLRQVVNYSGIILVANKIDLTIKCKFTQNFLNLSFAVDHHLKKKKFKKKISLHMKFY